MGELDRHSAASSVNLIRQPFQSRDTFISVDARLPKGYLPVFHNIGYADYDESHIPTGKFTREIDELIRDKPIFSSPILPRG
jgi:hypothetical protein